MGIPVKPGGGLGPETPRPGGGGGEGVTEEDEAAAEAFNGKELLKPKEKRQQWNSEDSESWFYNST